MDQMLQCDPNKRITAADALESRFLKHNGPNFVLSDLIPNEEELAKQEEKIANAERRSRIKIHDKQYHELEKQSREMYIPEMKDPRRKLDFMREVDR